jgi:hypothetical protein
VRRPVSATTPCVLVRPGGPITSSEFPKARPPQGTQPAEPQEPLSEPTTPGPVN